MSKSTCKKQMVQGEKNSSGKATFHQAISFAVTHPNAAGIDIGDRMHAVAVPPGSDREPVRKFGAFTCDLLLIVKWLTGCGVTTVAMESTGVYWKPLYALLIQNDIDVWLVNSKQTKNISGRKTDMTDAAWIQQLHSCGLLKRSFLPDDLIQTLRSVVRQRRALLQDSSRCVQRIQKNLELMNVKIHTVINDLMGKTGRAIVEAIIRGERKAENFMAFIDIRIRASREDILKSMEGNWRPECLFLIKQCYIQYEQLEQHVRDCDQEVENILGQLSAISKEDIVELAQDQPASQPVTGPAKAAATAKKKKKKSKNTPVCDVRQYLNKIHGVDVLDIFGISEITALEILSETGTDLSKWETENHFISWLNLCPNNKITGGKLISSKLMKKLPNTASKAFKAAANGLQRTDNWLGDYFRRMRGKGGQKYAIVCTARKLGLIYYKMVKNKTPFMPVDIAVYKAKQNEVKIASMEKKLAELRKSVA